MKMDEKAFEGFNLYNELEVSLQEAIAYSKGDKSKGRSVVRAIPTPEYTGLEVRQIRDRLRLSQNGFAIVLGVSKRTVEAWESGRNAPSNSTNKLLYLIEKNNELIDQLISV